MKRKINIYVLFVLVVLIGWGIYDNNKSSKEENSISLDNSVAVMNQQEVEVGLKEGNKAPDFQLKTLDGETVQLSKIKGKKIILNFWATWCPPCKAEMPQMQDFYVEHQNNNFEILAVNLTTAEKNSENVGAFVKDYGITFPILLDRNGEIGDTYQAITIPTSYIIDSKGIIRKRIIGPMDKEMMYELINNIE